MATAGLGYRQPGDHHHVDGDVNFGVTTCLWDWKFRTGSPRLQPVIGILDQETRFP
jgi:sterol desaturase/sphingolipid hydroxylase (fatty acid hydroxylase superfamily)